MAKQTPSARDVLTDPTREAISRVAKSHGVTNLGVFGSFARREGRQSSDLDLLVDLE